MIALALDRSGCEVSAVYPRAGHPLARTSIVKKRFVYSPFDPVQSLLAAIESAQPEWIVPCDDRAVAHLHAAREFALTQGESGARVAALIERSLGDAGSYRAIRSRYEFLSIAREAGVLIPDTFQIASKSDIAEWEARRSYPWVMKTDGSWGGHGVKIVHSREQAQCAFSELNTRTGVLKVLKRWLCNRDAFWLANLFESTPAPITAQAYVRGRPANRAVFCSQGEVISGLTVEVLVAQGPTGAANVIRRRQHHQIAEATRILARRLNLSGYHGFDFVIEERTGNAYLLELNPRCTPPCHLNVERESNLAAALFSHLRPGEPCEVTAPICQDLIAYFPQTWQLDPASEFLRSGYHAVPWEEPELLRELLRTPYADRSLLARLSDRMRNLSVTDRASRLSVFHDRA